MEVEKDYTEEQLNILASLKEDYDNFRSWGAVLYLQYSEAGMVKEAEVFLLKMLEVDYGKS